MAGPKRLILFVEGEGDSRAVPVLVKQLLTEIQAWEHVSLDPKPLKVGNVAEVTRENGKKWLRHLHNARKRSNLGGILVVQDGDLAHIRGEKFCSFHFAARLANWSRAAGGGTLFSLASVFACMEYESWLLPSLDRLAGFPFPDGRPGIRPGTAPPEGNLEDAPRDAKGWLDKCIDAGYKPTRDQGLLTMLAINNLDLIRLRGLRSFQRLESALQQLVTAIRTGTHVATPEISPSPPN
ncbi:MAG TPA: DUF4276 family protein [Gemmataceae bacterium]|jgi:hypothetical protein|nr:DUF4276 family protein [Gemmataceae bacterium]